MIMMNPMVIWYLLVSAVLIASLCRLICYLKGQHRLPHMFGRYREKEICYVPGDKDTDDLDAD